jgi:gluconolactonase
MTASRYSALAPPVAASEARVRTAALLAFTEGPAVDEDDNLHFTDIVNDRIVKLAADGTLSVLREPSGRANGQVFDRDGVLYHCEGAEFGPHGRRRITRTNLRTGAYEVVTERYDGARYNSPNDICVDGSGRLYFSDPRYGNRDDLELDVEGVYRIDSDGSVTRILEQPQIERPNGVAVTQDARLLYVVDTSNDVGGSRRIWRFGLDERGHPDEGLVVHDFAPGRGGDGIELDLDGNLYVAAGINTPRGPHESADVPAGIYVLSPDGEPLARIPVPEDTVTNLAFGGRDGRTLYVTAGKSIFTTRVDVPGQVAYPLWHPS